jgi:transcriptional regulator with PAS, ATPase and Fis domain
MTLPVPEGLARPERARALVFEDARSVLLLQRLSRIAPSEANVLITGETGTGKELVARQVHQLSYRRDAPFVAVNCGAFSETLVEGELFGHEKGAFTGAHAAKAGWFETANGGTLFLDEIGDLPLPLQVKLLRVLQEREVVRVGARKPIPIDVRLIAATNIRLEEAVRVGNFREDLFYRLRVAELDLLPLRERPRDILPLARHFLEHYRQRLKLASVKISPSAEAKLLSHRWPGNIRELENVLHHALLIARSNLITPDDLHIACCPVASAPQNAAPLTKQPAPPALARLEAVLHALFEENHDSLFEEIETAVMKTAYEYCHCNQVQAAMLLGISRNVLRARLIRQGFIAARK